MMLRQIHALPGLIAAVLVAVLAITGAILSLDPVLERAGSTLPKAGQISVAELAGAVTSNHREVDRIVKTASGSVIAYYFDGSRAAADLVDPKTGLTTAPYAPSGFIRLVTNLHRSLLMGDAGRATAGFGALAMVVLAISGAMMLAARLGGWSAILRPVSGTRSQRFHSQLGRLAVLGLMLSALTACYLSLATFGILPDGAAAPPSAAIAVNGGARMPVGQLAALKAVDLSNLRELTFPNPGDPADVYVLTTGQGIGQVDAATGALIAYQPHSLSRQVYETIYMLHTGQGLWPLALILGLAALCVPALSAFGAVIWWKRRRALPRIPHNVGAQSADTIILVGSEGNSTWGFAGTLHAALTKAGHRVHTAPMNRLAPVYAHAARMLILTATYGDGAAPASAKRFLARLDAVKNPLPVAVVGFGDRSFPHFCRFAEDVAGALRDRGWPALSKLACIDRQSAQDFARWGTDLSAAMGTELTLTHIAARPKTIALELIERVDYGAEVQAPTVILRFAAPKAAADASFWRRLRAPGLPEFEPGDLVGILPPGSELPRFYSLASGSRDGVLEICVRKQPGGLCSSFLHELEPGDNIAAFVRKNLAFRPVRGKAPLILIGAGTGIGPLAGFIRYNTGRRRVHLYWGGRDPASDFLYQGEMTNYLADRRLTHLKTVFSRIAGGSYVQDRIASDANELRDLIQRGAQVLVCGGRDMAAGVAHSLEAIIRPAGLELQTLKANGRYLEDVY
jgi:sulfite reductase (NADPH) flavoprotein alpha-component